MTAFDRFETRLPELLTELAEPNTPDYVTDMLRLAARTRQRPAWSAPERWFPMGTLARTLQPVRFLPWRGLAIAILLLVLCAAAVALYVGSQHRLPPPFGPARNGSLLTSTTNGDIVALDPATGTTRPVLSEGGVAVTFNSTGQAFYFDKSTTGAPDMWVANADGTGSHHVWSGPATTSWIDWSQDGRRLVIADHPATGGTTVHLVDAMTGDEHSVVFDQTFTSVAQPFGSHTLLLVHEGDGQPAEYDLANDDGTNLHALGTVAAQGFLSLSGDGTRVAYSSWDVGAGLQGRIHVLNLASGVDTVVTRNNRDGNTWVSPVFSPDGTQVAVQRFTQGTSSYDLRILATDGSKPTVRLGTAHDASNGQAVAVLFSPDGSQLIARYPDDSTGWIFNATSGVGQPLAGITTEFFSWQRTGE